MNKYHQLLLSFEDAIQMIFFYSGLLICWLGLWLLSMGWHIWIPLTAAVTKQLSLNPVLNSGFFLQDGILQLRGDKQKISNLPGRGGIFMIRGWYPVDPLWIYHWVEHLYSGRKVWCFAEEHFGPYFKPIATNTTLKMCGTLMHLNNFVIFKLTFLFLLQLQIFVFIKS